MATDDQKFGFISNLNGCTFHYGENMSSLRIDPPAGLKIGLGMGDNILRACESHDDLVAALREILPLVRKESQDGLSVAKARAALAKANGGA